MKERTSKRRFGVSISEDVADDLDTLAKMLGVDRSRIIEEAVRSYLEDHRHLMVDHKCSGVIVALCSNNVEVATIVRSHKRIIHGYMHMHLDAYCLDLIIVNGESRSIALLYGDLKKIGCRVRYLPVFEAYHG